MSEKYPNLQKTELAWDPYMRYLVFAIDEANYLKRAETKPMMTPRHADEPHLTSRATHLRETADISKRIAVSLGLNDDLAYVGMLLHDAGHPFSAHEGEVIFSSLNEIYNVQYFHHNSKGLGVIWQEGILEDALGRIPDLTPELEKQLRDEFYYFLDIVISHDGEARKSDLTGVKVNYNTLQEAVEEKAKQANSKNNYKFIAQTPEGQVAKYSDAIAYLATDIQDAFRMGFLEDFDDEYLEIIGSMIINTNEKQISQSKNTKADKIAEARKMIDQLQRAKLKEQFSDIDNEIDLPLIEISRTIQREIEQIKEIRKINANRDINKLIVDEEKIKGSELSDQEKKKIRQKYLSENPLATKKEIEKAIDKRCSQYRKDKNPKTTDELLECNSEEEKIKEFTKRFLGMPSSVVKAITEKIQDYFINDILENSKPDDDLKNNMPSFSEEALDLMDKLKKKNMREFVIDTKWEYQQKHYPEVALKMVKAVAADLIRTGVIRHQFSNATINKIITSPDAKKHMKVFHQLRGNTEEERIKRLEKKINSNSKFLSRIEANFKNDNSTDEQKHKAKEHALTCKIVKHIKKKGKSFADQYMYTYNAIPSRIKAKVERAFSDNEKNEKKNEFYDDIIQEQLDLIREKFAQDYSLGNIPKEQLVKVYNGLSDVEKNQFINELVENDRENMEYKMAIQFASDYFAGMTDESFKHTAISLGYLTQDIIDNATRGGTASKSVQAHLSHLEKEDER